MGVFARILGIVFALAVALVIASAIWVQDANRLKPELQALVAQHSDYTAQFKGDITWSLFPPLHLKAQAISLTGVDEHIAVGALDLKMDLSAMWQDVNEWRVTEFTLTDVQRTKEQAVTSVQTLNIQNFKPGKATDFYLDAQYRSAPDAAALAGQLDGQLIYYPATNTQTQRLTFMDTQVSSAALTGSCNADVSESKVADYDTPQPQDSDLLPLDLLHGYDFSTDCVFNRLVAGTETFSQVSLDATNIAGQINALLNIKDFLGGSLLADIDINTLKAPVRWTILPEMKNVDSQRLIDWSKQRLQWVAAIAMNSKIQLQGNSRETLLTSIQAASEFDGGQGQLNISKIKQQLMQIALLARKGEDVSAWPDIWDYEEFTGRWNINGADHDLKFALDNMSVAADGTYDPIADSLNMLAQVTVHEAPEGSPFRINPLLEGTAIPVRCQGTAADPKCALDQGAAQKLVAKALQQGDDSGLRRKLEKKIDEDVPEEYREAAKGILDLLGRALEGD
jgi:AsmA-like protein